MAKRSFAQVLVWFAIRMLGAAALFFVFMVLSQDFQIFPGLYQSKLWGFKSIPTAALIEHSTTSKDGQTVILWKMEALVNKKKQVALIFHGNAEFIADLKQEQYFLRDLGISSYVTEYRGYYGRNSGWPSEKGFYLDAEAAVDFILKQENISASDLIIIGRSIGTGTASYTAEKYQTGTLVLYAPYTSLKDLIGEIPLLGMLTPFVKYNFPIKDYLANLTSTCIVISHGKKDTIIPFTHSSKLSALYKGKIPLTFVKSEDAGHNDLVGYTYKEVGMHIINCIK